MPTTRTELHTTLQRRLRKAQEATKTAADKHCRDVQYVVDDWVYVRLRPYRQTSLASKYTKLSKHFYGPFQVQEHVGPMAYKLQFPFSSRLHPIFHVSFLKPHQGPLPTTSAMLPPIADNHNPLVSPLSILDWKWDNTSSTLIQKVLMQWDGLVPEDTS